MTVTTTAAYLGSGKFKKGNSTVGVLVGLALLTGALVAWCWVHHERPFGIAERAAWTSHQVSGSPEPPDPYLTERAYPKLSFDRPLDITWTPDGKRAFVVTQHAKIYSFRNDQAVDHADLLLDLSQVQGLDKIPDCKGAGDSYGMALHPKFDQNRYCYICYTHDYTTYIRNHENGSRISRFTIRDTDPPTIDPTSEVVVLSWLQGGHNGGCVKFGPDGYLYISTGDAGDPNPPDPFSTGQDISDLLSSVLRIDVDRPDGEKQYSIPPDNPFVKTPGARGEVWCYGLRNPWRMNFDKQTGNLWIGDVGWELWESVDCAKSGGNYGWSIMEGPNPVHPNGKRGPTPIIKPQAAMSHVESASITGGLVYRGHKIPGLNGSYIYGDWQTSRLWAAKCNGETLEPYRTIAHTDQRIVAFGEDPEGEPVIVDLNGGGLWHIVPNPDANRPSHFPRKLSETGIFASTKDQKPAAGVLPFAINAPQWVDGATGERWVAFPGNQTMTWGKGVWGDDKPEWPKDSVLVRTLSMEMRAQDPTSSKRVETQLLHYDGRQWMGYSYAWNDDQTDAELQPMNGSDRPLTIADPKAPGGTRQQQWRYASRAQCMTCHSVWCDYALAFNLPQLDRTEKFPGENGSEVLDNQIRTFRHLGLLITPKPPLPPDPKAKPAPPFPPGPAPEQDALTNPYDGKADLNERARSYLHVNCSVCHRFGGGGTALIDLSKQMHLDQMKAIDEAPLLGSFGIDDPRIIFAGDPSRSVLLYRACKLGSGRMPHIGSDRVDEKGTELLRRWIGQLADVMGTPASSPATLLARSGQTQAAQAMMSPGATPATVGAAADSLLTTTSGAMVLLGGLDPGSGLPDSARQEAVSKAIAAPLEPVHDLFRRFDPKESMTIHLGSNFDRAALVAKAGDAAHGRKVFFESAGGLCAKCHRIDGQGTDFGPDLSHVAAKYDKSAFLENVVDPSKTIAEGFTSYIVKTKGGDMVNGLLVSKSDTEVVLKDTTRQYHVPAAEIQKMVAQTISAMPDGLLADLSPQDAADLLTFLATLK